MRTRAEHIQWCKDRALEYCNRGDPDEAFASMMSDIRKHPETDAPALTSLGMMLKMSGQLKTVQQVREFIKGFN